MKNLIKNKKGFSIILASLVFLVFGFTTNILRTKIENIPGGHFTQQGTIPPLTVNLDNPNQVIWSFVNNTECDLGFTTYYTVKSGGGTLGTYSTPTLVNDLGLGAEYGYFTSGNVAGSLGLSSGTVSISNLSFRVFLQGVGGGQELYPSTTGVTVWSTGQASPCDCLQMTVYSSTHQILVEKCNP